MVYNVSPFVIGIYQPEELLVRDAIRSCPDEDIQPYIAESFATTPMAFQGPLRRLPPEILSAICRQMDIQTCFRSRQVSRFARQLVSALPEYRAISRYAWEALSDVLRTGMAAHLTLSDIYRPLCSKECSLCGGPGCFLFLPTATRCCISCLGSCPELAVVYFDVLLSFAQRFVLPEDFPGLVRRRFQVLRAKPHKNNPVLEHLNISEDVILEKAAEEILRDLGAMDPASILGERTKNDHLTYMVSTAFPYFDREAAEVHLGLGCKGCKGCLMLKESRRQPPSASSLAGEQ